MDASVQNQERVPENLNKLLAVAVRSIQWSYAIFWSLSSRQQGVLEWNEGYYNGDIKTRKTVQATELVKADRVGVQRSEQLRELYKSLLEGETDEEAKRPCAALSPEDLTDSEWYYLVCMSFVFTPGQGLPGRALASGEAIWLCDAHQADSKVFSRSLLAKSASIQTVVCFPHLGGVIELGVTEQVLEDHSLIQHIKASLLEFSKPVCSDKSSSHPDNENDGKDPICIEADHEIADKLALESLSSSKEDAKFDHTVYNELEGTINEDYTTGSSDDCSHRSELNDQTEEDFKLDGGSSNCTFSLNSKRGNVKNHHLKELRERSQNLGTDEDLHYRRTLFTLLENSQGFIQNSCLQSHGLKSSFLKWKTGGEIDDHGKLVQQSILKKILFNVPLMYGSFSVKSREENSRIDSLRKKENGNIYVKNTLPDKRTENEKFLLLGSMVPSISKIDKASILDDTIHYLKELEARIQELESCSDISESEARTGTTFPDMVEHISDNYGSKPRLYKRKACDIDETDTDPDGAAVSKNDIPLDMKVHINDHEVLIEMTCLSREYILLDIIDAINNLNLDAHSVQSKILDGVLTLTLTSKEKYNTEKHGSGKFRYRTNHFTVDLKRFDS